MKIIQNPFIFYVGIVILLIVLLMPSYGEMPKNGIDKVIHWVIFFLLTISFLNSTENLQTRMEGLLWIILGGLLTEIVQQWIPGREMNLYDGVADTVGVLSGYYLHKIRGHFFKRVT